MLCVYLNFLCFDNTSTMWRIFCFLEDGLSLNKANDSDVSFQLSGLSSVW
jgi:hypothetical protein